MNAANQRGDRSSRNGPIHTRYCAPTPGARTKNTVQTSASVAKICSEPSARRRHAIHSAAATIAIFNADMIASWTGVRPPKPTGANAAACVWLSQNVIPQPPQLLL